MTTTHDENSPAAELHRLAEACAGRLPAVPGSFADDGRAFESELRALIDAVRALDARFAFDLAGRPAAIGAVREALPAMEREILDAVLDDHACEIAAVQEAMYRIAAAAGRSRLR